MAALEPELKALALAAQDAARNAYCPYSQFRVGAAILADDGSIFSGCNVENASYGLTVCAERNAVFQMVASGRHRIVAIAVYTPTPFPTPPCGACRQVIKEFADNACVISTCDGPDIIRTTVAELLPSSFDQSSIRSGAQ